MIELLWCATSKPRILRNRKTQLGTALHQYDDKSFPKAGRPGGMN